MPAGDLVLEPYQFEIRTTLFGFGTDMNVDGPRMGLRGFGLPEIKSSDTDYAHADGAFAAEDFLASRTLALPFKIVKSTEADAFNALATANTAWAPSSTDIPLYFWLPGWGKKYVNGRPRGLAEDLSMARHGVIPILATFFCPDPTIHT